MSKGKVQRHLTEESHTGRNVGIVLAIVFAILAVVFARSITVRKALHEAATRTLEADRPVGKQFGQQ